MRLSIYSLRGALVRTLVQGTLPAGHHEVRWDGTDTVGAPMASGAYFVRLDAAEHRAQQKLVLLK